MRSCPQLLHHIQYRMHRSCLVRALCGLVFILACCAIYIVGGGVCKMIANLAKGKDIV